MGFRILSPGTKVEQKQQPASTAFDKSVNFINKIGKGTGHPTEAFLNKPVLSGIARAGEAVLGLPGDIAQGISNIAGVENKVPLPTSAGLRQGTRALTGEALEPESGLEDAYQEFVGDLASLAVPIPGSGGLKLGKAAKLAGIGTGASQLAKSLDFSEGSRSIAKGASYLLSGLTGGRKVLTDQMNELYRVADESAKGATVPARGLQTSINGLIKEANTGILTPAKEGALKVLEPISDSIVKGTIGVPLLQQFKKDVNVLLQDPGMRASYPHLKRINGFLKDSLKEYGHMNPTFGDAYTAADKLYANLKGSLGATKFIKDKLPPEAMKHDLTKYLMYAGGLGGSLTSFYKNPELTSAILGAGGAIKWSARTLQLLMNSPEARKYYVNALKDASESNLRGVTKNAANLDKVIGHFEENPKGRFRVIS